MSTRTIEQVLRTHTPQLMSVPGVIGTGQGESRGRAAIVIYVIRLTPNLRARLPRELEGYPVVLRETGEVRAISDS